MLKLNVQPFPVLKTDRLVLRAMHNDDAEAIWLLRSDERVNKYIDRPKAITIEDAENFIKKIESAIANNESFYWGINLKNNNTLIGTICLFHISTENNTAEIGYELLPAFQGKGLMNEAITAVIELAFETIKVKTITAFLKPENERSVNILTRNNFKPDTAFEYSDKSKPDGFVCYYLTRL